MNYARCRFGRGFTLIELLMVVAIIAVLAAIAVPNFLEAQTRSKVSRALNDLRSVATGLESYRVDNNSYPPENFLTPFLVNLGGTPHVPNALRLRPLTTPIAYLAALPKDPFDPGTDPLNQLQPHTYHYAARNDPFYPEEYVWYDGQNEEKLHIQWIVQSYGPDTGRDYPNETFWQFPRYDSTNGTVSIGNILRTGP